MNAQTFMVEYYLNLKIVILGYLEPSPAELQPLDSNTVGGGDETHTSAALSITFSTLSIVNPCSLYVSVNKVADELNASVI